MAIQKLYQIDAFTDRVFGGNPAAVMPLAAWLPDAVMQQIAAENNLSETAFFVPSTEEGVDFEIRWFTPINEINLCGHATLAAAFVIFTKLGFAGNVVKLKSPSDLLEVAREGEWFTLNFPVWKYEKVPQHLVLQRALGVTSREIHQSEDWIVVLESAQAVREVAPNFMTLRDIDGRGVIVTAPGEGEVDFVSRAFFPKFGMDEDPVTGSSHCALVPYWVRRLGKPRVKAQQLSKRQGELLCELLDDRVYISGQARLFLEGEVVF